MCSRLQGIGEGLVTKTALHSPCGEEVVGNGKKQAEIAAAAVMRVLEASPSKSCIEAAAEIIELALHYAAREQEKRAHAHRRRAGRRACPRFAPSKRIPFGHLLSPGNQQLSAHIR
jgi:hypothetical protein